MEMLCTADDQALWKRSAHAAFEADMNACAPGCMGGARCTSACAQKRQPLLSSPCVTAYGALASCTAGKCWNKCIMGASPACESCALAHCDPVFYSTTGLDNSPLPKAKPRKATAASAAPSADADAAASVLPGVALVLLLLAMCAAHRWWRRRRALAPSYSDPLLTRLQGRKAKVSDCFDSPPLDAALTPLSRSGRSSSCVDAAGRPRFMSFEQTL